MRQARADRRLPVEFATARSLTIGMFTVRQQRLPNKELTPMADKTIKTKRKRLSKGQRAHVRRLKQAARKAGATYS